MEGNARNVGVGLIAEKQDRIGSRDAQQIFRNLGGNEVDLGREAFAGIDINDTGAAALDRSCGTRGAEGELGIVFCSDTVANGQDVA